MLAALIFALVFPLVFTTMGPEARAMDELFVILVAFKAGFFYNNRLHKVGKSRGRLPIRWLEDAFEDEHNA